MWIFVAVALVLLSGPAGATDAFNSNLKFRVYARSSDDQPDRLIGTTPLPKQQALRLPENGLWYVEPLDPITPYSWNRLLAEIQRLSIPGLDVSGHEEITDELVKRLARAPHLKILLLARTSVTPTGLAHLKAFPQLTSVSVNEGAGIDGLGPLAGLKTLTDLDISELRLSGNALPGGIPFEQLRRLVLPECPWTAAGLAPLARSRALQILTVSGELPAEALSAVGKARFLRALDLQRARFPAGALKGIQPLAALETLYLPDSVHEDDLSALASLPKLQTLDVTGVRLTPNMVKRLAKIRTLKALALTDTGIKAQDLLLLNPLAGLTLLELSGTEVRSGDLASLHAFKQLEVLALPQKEWSEADKSVLKTFKRLRVVALAGQPLPAALLHPIEQVVQPTVASIPKAPMSHATSETKPMVWKNKARPGIQVQKDRDLPVSAPPVDLAPGSAKTAEAFKTPAVLTQAKPPASAPLAGQSVAGLSGVQRLRALSDNSAMISDIIPADKAHIRSMEETPQNMIGDFHFNAK